MDQWIIGILEDYPAVRALVIILGILLGCKCIEFTPIKINPLKWLLGLLGRTLNASVNDKIDSLNTKVDKLQKDLDTHIMKSGEDEAKSDRNRILRFSDEIITGQEHTKEHYRDIIMTIDDYEKYCEDHPDFKNNRCVLACQNIKDEYMKRCKDNSFVDVERLVTVKK